MAERAANQWTQNRRRTALNAKGAGEGPLDLVWVIPLQVMKGAKWVKARMQPVPWPSPEREEL
jgi:hypothetical protein